jgi:tripartite-type tricarboxylate transporter receptor subunit TctC
VGPVRIAALAFASLAYVVSAAPAPAKTTDGISFKGKTATMIVPSTAGAGTDLSARLFARYFTKYLPGQPTFVASNVPSGHGVTALNFLATQAKPDGLTVAMGSDSQADPLTFRTPQSHYDPLTFPIVGAVGTSDTVLIIRSDASPRLIDPSAKPVNMGSVGGTPRASMRMAVWGREFLGWNLQWVVGYPGSSDLALALERGEIDMTTFPGAYLSDKLTDTGTYKVLFRSGFGGVMPQSGRADIDNAPLFSEAMKGKIADPKVMAAFDYWRAETLFKWLALPPKTPDAIVAVYREAYLKIADDPDFKKQAATIADNFTVLSPEEATEVVHALAQTSDEAIATMSALMSKQGLTAAQSEN